MGSGLEIRQGRAQQGLLGQVPIVNRRHADCPCVRSNNSGAALGERL